MFKISFQFSKICKHTQVFLFSHCIIVEGDGAQSLAGLPSHPCINDSCVLVALTRATENKNEPCELWKNNHVHRTAKEAPRVTLKIFHPSVGRNIKKGEEKTAIPGDERR